MTEWEVVGVIVALVGLLTAICKPVIQLTRAITKLTDAVETLERRLEREEADNRSTHLRLEARDQEQERKLFELEHRLSLIEQRE